MYNRLAYIYLEFIGPPYKFFANSHEVPGVVFLYVTKAFDLVDHVSY